MSRRYLAAIVAALGAVRLRAQEPIIITPAGPPQFGPPTQWPNGLCPCCKQWEADPFPADDRPQPGPTQRIVECGWCHGLFVQHAEAR